MLLTFILMNTNESQNCMLKKYVRSFWPIISKTVINLFEQAINKLEPEPIPYSVLWKRSCFYGLMDLMKEKRVKYATLGNTPEAHLAFLGVNKDISG